jgi:uncharacterized protein
MNSYRSHQTIILELLAIAATAIGKFFFMDFLKWRLSFIVVCLTGWLLYILYWYMKDSMVVRNWGFRQDTFWPTVYLLFPFALLSIMTCLVVGYYKNTLNLHWHILPLLVVYPIWGTIQQFLVMSLVAGNLQDLKIQWLNKSSIILISAILFGALHFPYLWLMIGTFVLSLVYGFIFLKIRNLYALGIFHGWLGALIFYSLVNRDPWAEVFGNFPN